MDMLAMRCFASSSLSWICVVQVCACGTPRPRRGDRPRDNQSSAGPVLLAQQALLSDKELVGREDAFQRCKPLGVLLLAG
jgi:hypothetical protein